jgi:uncharacterized protein
MNPIEQDVRNWLVNVVIGLDLCPFASRPQEQSAVHFAISSAANDEEVLADLQAEIESLAKLPPSERETTLLIIPNHLQDFADYNDFLDSADWLIEQYEWVGVFQIASFHPDYCFNGTSPEDKENLTNRSPYPILHVLREESLERAIAHHPDVDSIPTRNIQHMQTLSAEAIARLFPYLQD